MWVVASRAQWRFGIFAVGLQMAIKSQLTYIISVTLASSHRHSHIDDRDSYWPFNVPSTFYHSSYLYVKALRLGSTSKSFLKQLK